MLLSLDQRVVKEALFHNVKEIIRLALTKVLTNLSSKEAIPKEDLSSCSYQARWKFKWAQEKHQWPSTSSIVPTLMEQLKVANERERAEQCLRENTDKLTSGKQQSSTV